MLQLQQKNVEMLPFDAILNIIAGSNGTEKKKTTTIHVYKIHSDALFLSLILCLRVTIWFYVQP